MIDVKTADRELQTYLRPQTFPVAIRMLKPGEPIPDRARRPARDFGKLSMSCQVIDMSRRYGWTIALTREDHICSLGITAIGFDKPLPIYNIGTLCEGMYTETKEAGQRSEAAIDKFAPGEYETLLVAPLDRATFEPHVVCVYANPAQVMRLTQAALWKRGGRLASSFEGRAVCADIIVTTMQTQQPQVILPCSGDRIFGQTQDHEMAFSIPWAWMDDIVEGLRGTHGGGIRYPITQFMEYEAKLPPRYMEVNRLWDAEKGKVTLTNRDRVVAAYKRSFADRVPVYPIVASFAGTLDGLSIEEYCINPTKAITAMMNYYERYQPDVVLAYNDLAKEAEAFGCGVKYSDYVVPSIERHVLEDKGALASLAMPDPYKTARLPGFLEQCEALVKAKPPAATGAVAVGPWTIAMLLRNPEMMLLDTFEDPQFIHDLMRVATDFSKAWGDAIVKTGIGLSFSEPTASISLISPGQLPRVHRALSQGAGRPLQGEEGRRDHAHLRDDLPDLRGPHQVRVHHDLVRPRPAGRPRAPRRPARAVHGGRQGPRRRHRQRGRDQVREDHEGGDGGRRAPLHRRRRPALRLHPVRPRARSRRGRTRRSWVVHGRGARIRALRARDGIGVAAARTGARLREDRRARRVNAAPVYFRIRRGRTPRRSDLPAERLLGGRHAVGPAIATAAPRPPRTARAAHRGRRARARPRRRPQAAGSRR